MTIEIDKAIEKEIQESLGHYEDFDGKNCDDCSGWTVGEHRCDCGNRRICWGHNILEDGTILVFPEAY